MSTHVPLLCPCLVQHIAQNFVYTPSHLNALQSCPEPPCIVINSPMTISTTIDYVTKKQVHKFYK